MIWWQSRSRPMSTRFSSTCQRCIYTVTCDPVLATSQTNRKYYDLHTWVLFFYSKVIQSAMHMPIDINLSVIYKSRTRRCSTALTMNLWSHHSFTGFGWTEKLCAQPAWKGAKLVKWKWVIRKLGVLKNCWLTCNLHSCLMPVATDPFEK